MQIAPSQDGAQVRVEIQDVVSMRLVVIIQTSEQERVTIHPLPVPPRLLAVNEPPERPELAIWSKLSVEAMSHTVLVEDIPPD